METRANHVWVGTVTLVLFALVVAGAIWIARISRGETDDYDIFFAQSVDGLGKGSAVTYAGVPAGQVKEIELSKGDPGLVRVRISVSGKIPILKGTSATLQGSFTGVSTIQLNGGVKGAGPIETPGREGVPEIPPVRSGLGELLSSAPQLLDRLTSLTEKLGNVLSDQNVKHLNGVFANTDRLTRNLADASPQAARVMTDLDVTLQQADATLGEFQKVGMQLNGQLDPNGQSVVRQLHDTLAAAKASAEELRGALAEARPATRRLTESTLPEAEAAIADLRASSRALRDVMEKVDAEGAGAVVAAPKLPVYKP